MKLDLRGNDLQELPTGAFRHTPYLTHLSMQRCNIRHVKEGAFRGLGRLVFLNLANNNIEILYQVRMHLMSTIQHFLIWQDPDFYFISTNVKGNNVPVPFFAFLVSRSLLMGSPR